MSRLRTAAAWGALMVGPVLLAGVMGAAADNKAADVKEPKTERNLDLAYAEAQFKLAEVSLKKLELTNQRFPRTISASVIADYAEDLAIAKAQLDSARQAADADLFPGWVRRVESNMKTAEASLASARTANQRQPGTVDPLDVQRLELRVEIAKLQLDRGKLLANAALDQKLEWQVQVLNDEVARLKEQTSRIAPQTRVYPWRY
jgi:hypothetical protein